MLRAQTLSYIVLTNVLYWPTDVLYCPTDVRYYPPDVLCYPTHVLCYPTDILYCPTVVIRCVYKLTDLVFCLLSMQLHCGLVRYVVQTKMWLKPHFPNGGKRTACLQIGYFRHSFSNL